MPIMPRGAKRRCHDLETWNDPQAILRQTWYVRIRCRLVHGIVADARPSPRGSSSQAKAVGQGCGKACH